MNECERCKLRQTQQTQHKRMEQHLIYDKNNLAHPLALAKRFLENDQPYY